MISKARFKPEVGLSVKRCRPEYLSLVRNLDQELELGGRMEAYVTKRIHWEENRHFKAGKEPFHLQFVGKSGSGKSVSAQRLMRILDGVVRVVYHIGVTRAWGADLPEYPPS